jgi:hypothetical protein
MHSSRSVRLQTYHCPNPNCKWKEVHPTVVAHELCTDKSSRKSSQDPHRGFGYVEFALSEDAHEAIDNMDQAELYGRVIKVNQAKPQKQAGEKLGSKTAIWEQVSLFWTRNAVAVIWMTDFPILIGRLCDQAQCQRGGQNGCRRRHKGCRPDAGP